MTASSNIDDGIATVHGTLATISNSVADRNGWRGISLDTAKAGTVRISGNYARYNAMDGVSLIEPYDQYNTSSGSSVGSTVASSNGGNGFYVLGSGHLTFTGDTAAGNGAFGFDLDGVDVGTVAATNNLAKANVDGGYFTTGYAVGGTGNVATGNGTPQCVNWTCRIK